MAKPLLKWVGGKRQLLPELLHLQPSSWRSYFEPMVGGGALFFELEPTRAKIGDRNPELTNAYTVVRDHLPELLEHLEVLSSRYFSADKADTYYRVRDEFNVARMQLTDDTVIDPEQAARMLFLNRTCFNGLWRVNQKGGFNVPWGKYKNPKLVQVELLREASRVLQDVEIVEGHYMKLLLQAEKGDFVYLDPPYVPLNPSSSFTTFTKNGFGEDDQRALAVAVTELAKRGVQVLLSNSDTPFCHGLYRNFPRVRVSARRNVNAKGDKRGPVSELVVFAGYEPPDDVEVVTGLGM